MLLDLKVVDKTGGFVTQCIRNLHSSTSVFNRKDYATKLVNFCLLLANVRGNFDNLLSVFLKIDYLNETGLINWDTLTEMALPIINRAPGISVMLSTFKPTTESVVALERKRRIRVKDKIAEKQTSEKVSKF